MNKNNIMVKFKNYNYMNNKLEMEVEFMSDELEGYIFSLIEKDKPVLLQISDRFRLKKTFPQLKRYHAILKRILLHHDTIPSKENMKALDMFIKRNVLDCDTLILGKDKIPTVVSKADMCIEELNEATQKVIDYYSYIPNLTEAQ